MNKSLKENPRDRFLKKEGDKELPPINKLETYNVQSIELGTASNLQLMEDF